MLPLLLNVNSIFEYSLAAVLFKYIVILGLIDWGIWEDNPMFPSRFSWNVVWSTLTTTIFEYLTKLNFMPYSVKV